MAPRAGLKFVNTARPVITVRSVNTGRPFSTARSFNTVRPSYTAHPKSTIHCARPRTYFQNQAQSTIQRPFYKRTALTNRCFNQRFNTGRPFRSTVNTVRARGFNDVKPSAYPSQCSRHMTGNITHLLDFKDFDGGYVTFGGGAYGGRITGKDVKSASTPTDLEKPLVQDGDAVGVDKHLYRSMIGSLMYLTVSRPYIIYLKGKPSLGLWYPKDSLLELVAYTDSDYVGATQDRKSTTRVAIDTQHNVADLLTKGFDAGRF
ncbi:hypothetical protein Tco_1108338 [Tanacetum coccineum]